jgi:hypothetical protein
LRPGPLPGYHGGVLPAPLRLSRRAVEADRSGPDTAPVPFEVPQALPKRPPTAAGIDVSPDDWEETEPRSGEPLPSMQEA